MYIRPLETNNQVSLEGVRININVWWGNVFTGII